MEIGDKELGELIIEFSKDLSNLSSVVTPTLRKYKDMLNKETDAQRKLALENLILPFHLMATCLAIIHETFDLYEHAGHTNAIEEMEDIGYHVLQSLIDANKIQKSKEN